MSGRMIEYDDASPKVQAIYDEIMRVRGFDSVPSYYKALGFDAATLEHVWSNVRDLYARDKIDTLTKELIAIAVCTLTGANYCRHQHMILARKYGMDDEMLGELLTIISVFSETSAVCKMLNLGEEF